MSKSITQDMRYRQSLMQYAAKYGVSRASGNTTRVGRISTSGRHAGMEVRCLCLPVQDARTTTQTSTQKRTEAHPRHAEAESHAGMVELCTGFANVGIPAVRKVCSGSCASWGCSRRQRSKQPTRQNHTNRCSIPASAFSRCEGGAAEMPDKPGRTAIPVYGDRRIYTPSLSGRISRTKHLLFR